MKKYTKIILPIAIVAVIAIIVSQIIRPVRLNDNSTVILNYSYGETVIETELSEADAKRLCEICEGTIVNDFSIPSCGFDAVQLTFKSGLKTTCLYPACDGCDTMVMGDNQEMNYTIGTENREELEQILEKYGVQFPSV